MQIFLSHASEAKNRVRAVCRHLPSHIVIWLDKDKLHAGVEFPSAIIEAITRECDFVVVFVDSNSLKSAWVLRETRLALDRERDLGRPFLIPIVIEPVAEDPQALGISRNKIYIDATSEKKNTARAIAGSLCDVLFAHTSKIVEDLRGDDRRSQLIRLSRSMEELTSAASNWYSVLGEKINVLAKNQAAFDYLRETVIRHNSIVEPLLARLPAMRDRIMLAWARHRGLCNELQEFIDWVERDVIRGHLFNLNKIHAMIHHMALNGVPDSIELERLEGEKQQLIKQAEKAITTLSHRSNAIIANFEREL